MKQTIYSTEGPNGLTRVCCQIPESDDGEARADVCGPCGGGRIKKIKPVPHQNALILINTDTEEVIIMDGSKTFVIPHIYVSEPSTVRHRNWNIWIKFRKILAVLHESIFTLQEMKGEMIIAVAHKVHMFTLVCSSQNESVGSLFVTNYKISFLTRGQEGCKQMNHILGPNDIPLNLVEKVVQLKEGCKCGFTSLKRRTLSQDVERCPKNIFALQIVCKNMRVMSFLFHSSPGNDKGTLLATAILFHAFPLKHESLFAFLCTNPYTPSPDMDGINMFVKSTDWKEEMTRTGCINFRVCSVRKVGNSALFRGPGYNVVVPTSIKETQLCDAVYFFFEGKIPIWVWSGPKGAALVRSGEQHKTFFKICKSKRYEEPEATLMEATRRSHPQYIKPHVISIPKRPLHISFRKIKSLCLPHNFASFMAQDNRFFVKLRRSKWLNYVSECLFLADEAAGYLGGNVSVVLQEGEGIDYCPIISSLTQLLLDSHFRTIKGFQSLIQKEWIALGHPFCDRLGHVTLPKEKRKNRTYMASPMFLIFLDCTWQLMQQFSAAFEFTDIYLITLWDSAHNHLFETFIYNSPRQRETMACQFKTLRPVWEWHEQFPDTEIQFFYNPVYSPPDPSTFPEGCGCPTDLVPKFYFNLKPSPQHLMPHTHIACLDFWGTNYFRWLSPMNRRSSGAVQILLFNIRLTRQYRKELDGKDSSIDLDCPHPALAGPFFPFS